MPWKKNKLEENRRLLKSAAAQYVAAGQLYNSDANPANERKMKDAEAVVGSYHKKTLELMRLHTENRFEVDPKQQRQYLISEMEKALDQVLEWKGQIELLQIDADTFYSAADRLVRAYTSVIKHVLSNKGKDAQVDIAKRVQTWGVQCQKYRDIFLPRDQKKWLNTDVHATEERVFAELDKIQSSIKAML